MVVEVIDLLSSPEPPPVPRKIPCGGGAPAKIVRAPTISRGGKDGVVRRETPKVKAIVGEGGDGDDGFWDLSSDGEGVSLGGRGAKKVARSGMGRGCLRGGLGFGGGGGKVNGNGSSSSTTTTTMTKIRGATAGLKEKERERVNGIGSSGTTMTEVKAQGSRNSIGVTTQFYLEDDFDSTVDLDGDSELPPPPPPPPPPSVAMGSTGTTNSKPKESANAMKKGDADFWFLEDDFDSTVILDGDSFTAGGSSAKRRRISLSPKPKVVPVMSGSGAKRKEDGYRRSVSNIEGVGKRKVGTGGGMRVVSAPILKRARTTVVEEDPILFTSSPEIGGRGKRGKRVRTGKEMEDDIFASSPVEMGKAGGKGRGLGKENRLKGVLEEDDIFASSPVIREATKAKSKGFRDESEDDIFASSPATTEKRKQKEKERGKTPSVVSKRAAGLGDMGFEELSASDDDDEWPPESEERARDSKKKLPKESGKPVKKSGFIFDDLSEDSEDLSPIEDILSHSKTTLKTKKKTSKPSQSTSTKEDDTNAKEKSKQEKAEKAKEKAAAKEAEKEQKQLAKEEKAREKARAAVLAKVNTKKTDKKIAAPEMIVDLPSCLNASVAEQVRAFLKENDGIEHSVWESTLPVVKWRRKVDAVFNEEMDIWEPCARHIKDEEHAMCIVEAKTFVELVVGEEGRDLDSYVLGLKGRFGECKIIFLVEGLSPLMKKARNRKNREFAEAVRSHGVGGGQDDGGRGRKRKEKEAEREVDEERVEDALLRLQVRHECLIYHTNLGIETAQWVWIFTQHIATIPYKTQKASLDTTFCMESGQVKTGNDASDTYTKMLQEIIRITASVAYGIAAEYPSVRKLVEGLEREGPLALEACRKSANGNGAFSDRKVGQAISKRVHKVFLGRDEGSWDV